MNNLLFSTLLFCVILMLINADCLTNFPEIKNATINKDQECGDVTINCDKDFTMEQVIECVDGKWIYQKPFCKPPECSYNFNRNTLIQSFFKINSMNQDDCDKQCDDDPQCTASTLDNNDLCEIYISPVIFLSDNTDLDQCIERCEQIDECVLLSHWGSDGYNRCHLFNVTQDNLPVDYTVYKIDGDTVVEKVCL